MDEAAQKVNLKDAIRYKNRPKIKKKQKKAAIKRPLLLLCYVQYTKSPIQYSLSQFLAVETA